MFLEQNRGRGGNRWGNEIWTAFDQGPCGGAAGWGLAFLGFLGLELEARRGATVSRKVVFFNCTVELYNSTVRRPVRNALLVIYCTKAEHAAYIHGGGSSDDGSRAYVRCMAWPAAT